MSLKKVKVKTVKMISKQNGMVELLSWKSPKTKKKVTNSQKKSKMRKISKKRVPRRAETKII